MDLDAARDVLARANKHTHMEQLAATSTVLAELDAARAEVATLRAENERLREAVFSSPEMARLLAAIDAVPPAHPADDPTTEEE